MYPDIKPFESGFLKVSEIHNIHYEQSGNRAGNPVIFLHGGPGAGCSERDRTFFDPNAYRIVLMDQRGAGKSLPAGELKENTTWDLVDDLEKLRIHLGIDKWVVFGGSWGSLLALVYAETHPDRVKALILRGIFCGTRKEVTWVNQEGASVLFPDAWEEYIAPIPEVERGDLVSAYYHRLTGDNKVIAVRCGEAWREWEEKLSQLQVNSLMLGGAETGMKSTQISRIECHYFIHGCFLKNENQVLNDIGKIRHIPTTIVHGRYDVVCPLAMAWKLHKVFPEAEFHIVPDAGHSSRESGVQALLLDASDKYKHL